MNINRGLQRHLLEYFAAYYPDHAGHSDFTHTIEYPTLLVNLCYLEKHGLIENKIRASSTDSQHPTWLYSKITARGLDLLADDGGLFSLFSNLSVRLPTATLLTLLEQKIAQLTLPDLDRKHLLDHLRCASVETLENIVVSLLEQAIEQLPESRQLLLEALMH